MGKHQSFSLCVTQYLVNTQQWLSLLFGWLLGHKSRKRCNENAARISRPYPSEVKMGLVVSSYPVVNNLQFLSSVCRKPGDVFNSSGHTGYNSMLLVSEPSTANKKRSRFSVSFGAGNLTLLRSQHIFWGRFLLFPEELYLPALPISLL